MHVNAAAAWTRADEPGAFGGVIVEGHDAWRVRPVAEVFVEARGSAPTVSGLAGAVWRVRERLSSRGRQVRAIRPQPGPVGAGVGCALRPPLGGGLSPAGPAWY
jgi:hypothetical protein